MAHPNGRNSYEHRRKERDLRRGADCAWRWRRFRGDAGAHRWNRQRHIHDGNDHRDDDNVAWKASRDRAWHHDDNARRDDAECEHVCTAEHRRDRNAEFQHLRADDIESVGFDTADTIWLPDCRRNEWMHDANDTDIADELDHAPVAHGHVSDGVPEWPDAASWLDNLSVIRGQNRNGSGRVGVSKTCNKR